MNQTHPDAQHNQRHGNNDHEALYVVTADITSAIATHSAASDPHTGYATDTDLSTHAAAADPHTGYVLESLLDVKGDLIVASAADTPALLAVAANDAYLTADSAQTTGLRWDIAAWSSYTPTLANIVLGNSQIAGFYKKIGRMVHFYVQYVQGSTGAMGSNPTYTLPVAASSRYSSSTRDVIGRVAVLDSGTANFGGISFWVSSTTGALQIWNSASTYLTANSFTATVPMTWTTNDAWFVWGTYESAA